MGLALSLETPAHGPKPFLRWAGSKRASLSLLLNAVPPTFGTYYEPFAGSGCLFFALRPDTAVLGDINEALINTYRAIRSDPQAVHKALQRMVPNKTNYYRIRETLTRRLDEVRDAARFIFLNRYCFNGVYRTNRAGQFNVPFGRKTGTVPSAEDLTLCSRAMARTDTRAVDFEECLATVRVGDFVYVDPPYIETGKRYRGEYGTGSFSVTDCPRLVGQLHELDKLGALVMLSYSEKGRLDVDLRGWRVERYSVMSRVSGARKGRALSREVLLRNW